MGDTQRAIATALDDAGLVGLTTTELADAVGVTLPQLHTALRGGLCDHIVVWSVIVGWKVSPSGRRQPIPGLRVLLDDHSDALLDSGDDWADRLTWAMWRYGESTESLRRLLAFWRDDGVA